MCARCQPVDVRPGASGGPPQFKNAVDGQIARLLPEVGRYGNGSLLENPGEDSAALAHPRPNSACSAGWSRGKLSPSCSASRSRWGDRVRSSGHCDRDQLERRPLVEWCKRFAKARTVAGHCELKCWCKTATPSEGEIVYKVAIRHELFSQIKADAA